MSGPWENYAQPEDGPWSKFSVSDTVQTTAPEPSIVDQSLNVLKDAGAGFVKGASDIGATLLRPLDATGITGMSNVDRKASIDQFMQENANPESIGYKAGQLGAGIAGTAGAGSLIAKGIISAYPFLAGASPALMKYLPQVKKVATAIESGGFSTGAPAATTTLGKLGNAAVRVGGGAVSGAATAGMINPEDAGTGAVIGASIPVAGKVAGEVGKYIGQNLKVSQEVAALYKKAKSLGIDIPADRLVNSPALNAASASLRYVPFSGRAGTERTMEGQLNRALSRTFGQDTDNITMGLRNASKDLNHKFETTLSSNTVKVDNQFLQDMTDNLQKARNELGDKEFKIVENQVNDILAKTQNGIIDGQAAYNIKKTLDRIGNRSSNESWYATQLRKSLMGALDRSLGPDGAKEFANVRRQYGTMLDLEGLAKNGAEGDISVARLANMKNINNPELQDIADIAAQFVRTREAPHGAAQRVGLGLLAGGVGTATGTLPAVGAGIGVARLSDLFLNSNATKNALLSANRGGIQSAIDSLTNPMVINLPNVINAQKSP